MATELTPDQKKLRDLLAEVLREQHQAILAALALAHPDRALRVVDVRDLHANQFADPEPGFEQGADEEPVPGAAPGTPARGCTPAPPG